MSDEIQIDFSFFIGQKLVDVNTDPNSFLMFNLENGYLSVECPWRLRNKKEILIGEADCISAPERYSRNNLKRILLNKMIKDTVFSKDLFLLTIEFEDELFFDLFHNSNYFEGWVLQGEDVIFSVPGGEVPL